MEVQRLNPSTMPKPAGPYCQVVRKGPIVTTAGAVAFAPSGELVGEGDVGAQTRQVLENVKAALEAAGASLADVVKTTVFITNVDDFQAMNRVYLEFFGDHPAARSTVRVDLMMPSLLVEIEAMAVVD